MTLPLTADICRGAYDYLNATPPFRKWNLPEGEDVVFKIVRDPCRQGWNYRNNKKQYILISGRTVGHTDSLMRVMAHEMVHIHQDELGIPRTHGASFAQLAAMVCKVHGFDPKLF